MNFRQCWNKQHLSAIEKLNKSLQLDECLLTVVVGIRVISGHLRVILEVYKTIFLKILMIDYEQEILHFDIYDPRY